MKKIITAFLCSILIPMSYASYSIKNDSLGSMSPQTGDGGNYSVIYQAPTNEAPTNETPTNETPTNEAPTDETPTNEAPTQNSSSGRGGGGGGIRVIMDICVNGDFSPSYYDRTCEAPENLQENEEENTINNETENKIESETNNSIKNEAITHSNSQTGAIQNNEEENENPIKIITDETVENEEINEENIDTVGKTISESIIEEANDPIKLDTPQVIYSFSSKEDIKIIQIKFKELGIYTGEIDGKYKSIIDTIKAYQLETGILQNEGERGFGYFGPKTKAQLEKDLNNKMKNDLEKEITEQLHNSYITQKEKTTQILTEEIEDIELNSAIDIDKETNMKRNKKSKKFGEIGITFVSVIALLILLLIIQTKQKKKGSKQKGKAK